MSKVKINRGPNFTPNEKEIIIKLVSLHKDVVENKKTDAMNTVSKNEGWEKIVTEFNSLSSFCVRTKDQIKTCWENIKRITRKEKASSKRETFLTGGGRSNKPATGPLQDQVEAILGPTLNGLSNQYHSDAFYSNDIEISEVQPLECSIIETAAPLVSQDDCLTFASEKENDWSGWSPAALQSKISKKLETSKTNVSISKSGLQRRRPKSSLQDEILKNKLQLVQTANKSLEIESKLKLEILEEQLKQEKIKTEILMLQLENTKK